LPCTTATYSVQTELDLANMRLPCSSLSCGAEIVMETDVIYGNLLHLKKYRRLSSNPDFVRPPECPTLDRFHLRKKRKTPSNSTRIRLRPAPRSKKRNKSLLLLLPPGEGFDESVLHHLIVRLSRAPFTPRKTVVPSPRSAAGRCRCRNGSPRAGRSPRTGGSSGKFMGLLY